MATKTISLKLEAYEKLKAARRDPSESFSQVVLRARWPQDTTTAEGLLRRYRERGSSLLSTEELDRLERVKGADRAPTNKWTSAP